MDGHIKKDTARNANVFYWRGCGVAADDFELVRLSNLSAFYRLARAIEARVEASIKTYLKLHTGTLNGFQRSIDRRKVKRNWFFAEDVFPCLCCLLDDAGMGIRGRTDHNSLNIRAIQHDAVIPCERGNSKAFCALPCSLLECISDHEYVSRWNPRGEMFGMEVTYAPGTDQAYFQRWYWHEASPYLLQSNGAKVCPVPLSAFLWAAHTWENILLHYNPSVVAIPAQPLNNTGKRHIALAQFTEHPMPQRSEIVPAFHTRLLSQLWLAILKMHVPDAPSKTVKPIEDSHSICAA